MILKISVSYLAERVKIVLFVFVGVRQTWECTISGFQCDFDFTLI